MDIKFTLTLSPELHTPMLSFQPACRLAFESGSPQGFASDFDVVKRIRSFARDLHFLVSFPGQQHNVSGVGLFDRKGNRFAAVDF
ncbi:MAG TPA: hypothetical protein VIX37_04920, partial [Candidatus Sulfotelmatobacter sp.]